MNKKEAIEKIKNIDTLIINDMITNQKVDMLEKLNWYHCTDQTQDILKTKSIN